MTDLKELPELSELSLRDLLLIQNRLLLLISVCYQLDVLDQLHDVFREMIGEEFQSKVPRLFLRDKKLNNLLVSSANLVQVTELLDLKHTLLFGCISSDVLFLSFFSSFGSYELAEMICSCFPELLL